MNVADPEAVGNEVLGRHRHPVGPKTAEDAELLEGWKGFVLQRELLAL